MNLEHLAQSSQGRENKDLCFLKSCWKIVTPSNARTPKRVLPKEERDAELKQNV